ncbi:hypothetical protein BJ508DRAFT_102755 [Ascobolus immersus RN42]|uniref:Uncharacterized protein n=1 Tax=Ascobolus immersus RN42 TaxID=1160509 RepID=A0A3N4IJY6_ASCIM|nr:hypothetical protein BJ508DRAFT_102755 [Ascobolus immersus RN42]
MDKSAIGYPSPNKYSFEWYKYQRLNRPRVLRTQVPPSRNEYSSHAATHSNAFIKCFESLTCCIWSKASDHDNLFKAGLTCYSLVKAPLG